MPGGSSLSISPAHVDALAPGARETFRVSAPAGSHITMTAEPIGLAINGRCGVANDSLPWLSIRPAAFIVGPSGHHMVHVRLAMQGASGMQDDAIIASVSGHNGNVSVNHDVGARLLASYPGPTSASYHACLIPRTAATPSGHASSVAPYIAIVVAVLIIVAIVSAVVGWNRHARRNRGANSEGKAR